jgi:HSP20 family protein
MLPVLANGNRLNSVFAEMDGLFNNLLNPGTNRTLPLNLWEDDGNVYAEVEMPGLTKNDVSVTVHKGVLKIVGEKVQKKDRKYWRNECCYGRFERSLTLPETVDTSAVDAHLENGILKVIIPKVPEAQPRQIQVKALENK